MSDVDWSTVKELGIQMPALGLMLVVVIVVMGTVMGVVVVNLRHNRTVAQDFKESVTTMQANSHSHQEAMAARMSEDTKSLRECLDKHHESLGRACTLLDRHETRMEKHEDTIRELVKKVPS